MKRGDIYYINQTPTTDSEQRAGRPGIIVSNDKCNSSSDVIEVVYTTAQPKKDLPTHVSIRTTPRASIALCEQPTPVAVSRIGEYIGHVTESEQANIDVALLIQFDLYVPARETIPCGGGQTEQQSRLEAMPDARTEAERDIYKELYESLMGRLLAKSG